MLRADDRITRMLVSRNIFTRGDIISPYAIVHVREPERWGIAISIGILLIGACVGRLALIVKRKQSEENPHENEEQKQLEVSK